MNIADIKAVAELTADALGVNDINVHVKDVRRGHAHYQTGYIAIPKWVLKYGYAYSVYYAVHEVCHIADWQINAEVGHRATFKALEKQALALWDMTIPKYRKAYPAAITLNGQLQPGLNCKSK